MFLGKGQTMLGDGAGPAGPEDAGGPCGFGEITRYWERISSYRSGFSRVPRLVGGACCSGQRRLKPAE